MGNITFSEIMNFYDKNNFSVYEDLKKDCQNKHIIPFVGAGLSVFCGYSQWPSVLKQLAKFIYDRNIRENIENIIKDENGDLLQAAQNIYDNYPRMLIELKKIIDYRKIKNCDIQKVYASAAYILPSLFQNGLVITTNFDRVLEEVYDKCGKKFGNIINPYESDHLAQIRQTNPHCLFKLHGDIGPEIMDINKLVFTEKQYNEAYASDGALMKELPKWFQSKKLLFLGCSLKKDRTMEVLQKITEKNPGLEHYAIIDCNADDIAQKCIAMGKLGISTIYYPEKKHEAVRVILEHLLEEIDCSTYQKLNVYINNNDDLYKKKQESRFNYNSGYIEFTGREKELEQLHQFCECSEKMVWWAITGSGGIGKSCLAYKFTEEQNKNGWKICWLNHNDYNNLSELTLPVDPCIVVIDDVQSHIQVIGEWFINILERSRSEKLRILLIEREGKSLDTANWMEMLQSPYDNTISEKCYCTDFLCLPPLSENELKMIMENFAEASGKKLTNNGYAERLLKTLQKVDSNLQRPIYALAIVDAWCDGKDPTRWDKKKILEYLVNRELKFCYERLQNLHSEKITKTMRSELENILARSCISIFLPLDAIADNEYPKLRNRANKLDMDFNELLQEIGIVHKIKLHNNKKVIEIEAVILDCPDIIKEYLVLKQAFDKKQLELILPYNWENDFEQLFFIRQLLLDYPEELETKNQFWNEFFKGKPNNDFSIGMYSNLLLGVTIQLPKWENRAVEQLERLYKQFQNNESVATSYANGLYNLTVEQTVDKVRESVDKLKNLYENFESNDEIAIAYASGLVNLSAKQPLEYCEKSVDKLKNLYERFESNEEIAIVYAKGLVNLSKKQPLEYCEESIDKLKDLYERFESNDEIAIVYANGLVNLSAKQPLEYCEKSIDKLKDLYERFESNEEIAIAYANGLVNLSAKQLLEYCEESIDKLKDLHERFKSNEKIAIVYANGLFNLSFKQTIEANIQEIQETIKQSEKLLTKHTQNVAIQLYYAMIQFNLTLIQENDTLQQTILQIANFLRKHKEANKLFQIELDKYIEEHPNHMERYASLII